MLNRDGIRKATGAAPVQILATPSGMLSVGIVVDKSLGVAGADADGVKVVKAGTPLTGDLTNRTTAFTAAKVDGSDVVGILLHDVVVTDSKNGNGTLLLAGMVNESQIDGTTAAKLVAAVKKGIPTIKFIK